LTIFNRQIWQKLFIISSAIFPKLFLMIKDPEMIKFARDANGPHTQFVFGQPCDLETRKGKTAPHHLVPFPIALVSLLAKLAKSAQTGV
jgi:hypothetical protein